MKRVTRFLRQYKLFGLTILTIVFGLVLQLTDQQTLAHWVLGIISIAAALRLAWDMIEDVRSGAYGIDILAITAIVTAVILKQYWAAIVVVLMLTGGESLEDYAERRAKTELDALLAQAPQTATVLRKNKPVSVKVDDIHPRDKIIIKPGELVPVDATILEGAASFNEASITGESLPQTKQVGDLILSGSINLDGAITAIASATAADSQYQQIVRLVQSAVHTRAPFVRLAERYSLPFTFTAFAIASAVWVLSGQSIRFLEVIIVATPCPLLLAAPIALISGMTRASRYGIIVKTGSALERLAEAETIAFDKTGTLTKGILRIEKVAAFGSHKPQDVLQLAASLEQNSNHVVAQAIVAGARSKSIKLVKAKHVRETPGQGIQAGLRGKQLSVGRLNFVTDQGVEVPTSFKASTIQQTAVYVGIGQELAGVITLSDELRPESVDTLQRLRARGLKRMYMVTGDNAATARAIAEQLDINEIEAHALPVDKLRVIEGMKHRPVVFVGDGVNDAPVLTAADVGIALGARGSTAASESADMVIMQDDLRLVATAHAIARRTFRIARQSILGGMLLSLGLMIVFATGKLSPLTGALLQEVVDVVVIINALRAHAGRG